jgi:hypothetical protein
MEIIKGFFKRLFSKENLKQAWEESKKHGNISMGDKYIIYAILSIFIIFVLL